VKRLQLVFISSIAILLIGVSALAAYPQHEFSVKEYNEFHEVLHHLQHDALPKGDFATIRTRSGELVKHGKRIVKLGVPKGTKAEKQAEFKTGLAKFNAALAKFRTDAKSGSDEQLKVSYSAVHDQFEELAGMLPK
jgi:hypothetical protein